MQLKLRSIDMLGKCEREAKFFERNAHLAWSE